MRDFEKFLMEKHTDTIRCTSDDTIDDEMCDAYDVWLSALDIGVLIKYANEYAGTLDKHIEALNLTIMQMHKEKHETML